VLSNNIGVVRIYVSRVYGYYSNLRHSSDPVDFNTWEGDMESRVFWCALMYETIITQELGLPKSGLAEFEGDVPLPTFRPFNSSDVHERLEPDAEKDDSFFHYHFLAQAANRIMLTRIGSSHYFYGSSSSINAIALNAQPLRRE